MLFAIDFQIMKNRLLSITVKRTGTNSISCWTNRSSHSDFFFTDWIECIVLNERISRQWYRKINYIFCGGGGEGGGGEEEGRGPKFGLLLRVCRSIVMLLPPSWDRATDFCERISFNRMGGTGLGGGRGGGGHSIFSYMQPKRAALCRRYAALSRNLTLRFAIKPAKLPRWTSQRERGVGVLHPAPPCIFIDTHNIELPTRRPCQINSNRFCFFRTERPPIPPIGKGER